MLCIVLIFNLHIVNTLLIISLFILHSWPRLFKERISPIQRINHYPVDKIYPLVPSRLFEKWIALSTRYPVDKFIHGKVGSINFYPPDKRHKHGRLTVASFTEHLVAKPCKPTSHKKENFPPAAWPVNIVHRLQVKMSISFWARCNRLHRWTCCRRHYAWNEQKPRRFSGDASVDYP